MNTKYLYNQYDSTLNYFTYRILYESDCSYKISLQPSFSFQQANMLALHHFIIPRILQILLIPNINSPINHASITYRSITYRSTINSHNIVAPCTPHTIVINTRVRARITAKVVFMKKQLLRVVVMEITIVGVIRDIWS